MATSLIAVATSLIAVARRPGISTEDQISGYNELAEIEGIEKLSPDDDVDCWMHEALFDLVLTRIVHEEGD
jgi:hypothetical protein